MKWLFKTNRSWPNLVIRLALGVVMFPHGAQKLLGWFGGAGFQATLQAMTTKAGLPTSVAFLVIIGESIGSIALIVGFATRFVSASFIIIMVGAIQMMHWKHGFFMNWFGQKVGEGFEYHVLVIAMSAALLIAGGGRWSVDGWIARD
jgi:putative oxidoreductase